MESSESGLSSAEDSEEDEIDEEDGKDVSSSGTSLDSSTENDENLPAPQQKIAEKKVTPQANKPRATSLALPKVVASISRPPTPTNQMPDSSTQSIPSLPIPSPIKQIPAPLPGSFTPTSSLSPSPSFSAPKSKDHISSQTGSLRSSSDHINLPVKKTKTRSKRKKVQKKNKRTEPNIKEPSDEEKDKKGKLGFRLRRRPASEILSDTDRTTLEKQLKMEEEREKTILLKKEHELMKTEKELLQTNLETAEKKLQQVSIETEQREQTLKNLEKEVEFLRKQNESFTFLSKTDDIKAILGKIFTKLDSLETTIKIDKLEVHNELSQQRRKLEQLEAEVSEKLLTGSKERAEKERNKMAKERICKNCRHKFTYSENSELSCIYHPGRWKKFRKHWTCCRQGKKSQGNLSPIIGSFSEGCTTGKHSSI